MNLLLAETALLEDIRVLSEDFFGRVRGFVDDPVVRTMASTHAANAARRKVDLGFNPFALVSDVYHRENFHSDVLATVLDPHGAHGQGDRFLRLFLEFLRDRYHLAIDPDDYRNATVIRESARIDVLIWDEISRKALILENKINGAGDMERQVVRYLEEVVDVRRLTCDTIVYLTLLQKKLPDRTDWTLPEIHRVEPLLRLVCAYEESGRDDDLYHGWLKACVDHCPVADVALVIDQYRQILLKLGQNAMNQPLMEAFYDLMKDPERHKTALSVIAMVNDLPAFRCQRLMEAFQRKASPFRKVYSYRPDLLVFENCGVENLKIHVETTHPERTVVSFWNCIEGEQIDTTPRKILSDLDRIDQFVCNEGWFNREFGFPSGEELLSEFLEDFLKKLHQYIDHQP